MVEAICVNGFEKSETIKVLKDLYLTEYSLSSECNDNSNKNNIFHAIVYENENPIAIGALVCNTDDAFIDYVYVIKEQRKKCYGDLVVKMLLDKAFRLGNKSVFIKVPHEVMDFFTRIGFVEVNEVEGQYDMFIQQEMINKCKN